MPATRGGLPVTEHATAGAGVAATSPCHLTTLRRRAPAATSIARRPSSPRGSAGRPSPRRRAPRRSARCGPWASAGGRRHGRRPASRAPPGGARGVAAPEISWEFCEPHAPRLRAPDESETPGRSALVGSPPAEKADVEVDAEARDVEPSRTAGRPNGRCSGPGAEVARAAPPASDPCQRRTRQAARAPMSRAPRRPTPRRFQTRMRPPSALPGADAPSGCCGGPSAHVAPPPPSGGAASARGGEDHAMAAAASSPPPVMQADDEAMAASASASPPPMQATTRRWPPRPPPRRR